MSELKPVKKAELARHWRVSPPYVTKLGKPVADGGKAMPEFFSIEDADNWRAVNAPPNSPRHTSKNLADDAKKNGDIAGTTTPRGNTSGKIIDVTGFIQRGRDFESLMIEQAEDVPQIAFGLYKLACSAGNSAEISSANKNWHESAKASAAVRGSFLDLQERTRVLLPLDQVMDIVGTQLQAVRHAMLKLGVGSASAANPQDPALAQRVMDAAMDRIFADLEEVPTRIQKELAAPLASATPVGDIAS